jgi:hypothetical protein
MELPHARAPPSAVCRSSLAPLQTSLEDAAVTGVQVNMGARGAAHALEAAYTRHTVHTDTYAVVCAGGEPGQRLSSSASLQLGRLSLDACGSSDFRDVRESSCSAAVEWPRASARLSLSEAAGELEALLELQSREHGGRRYAASACLASCEPSRLQLRRTERGARRTAHTRLAVDAAGALQLRWEQLQSRTEQGRKGAVERCVDLRRSGVGALLLASDYTVPLSQSAKLRCTASLGTQTAPEASFKLSTPRLSVALKQRHLRARSVQLQAQRGPRPSDAKHAWWAPQCTLSWDADDGPTVEVQAADGPAHERGARLTLELQRTRLFAACAFGTLA